MAVLQTIRTKAAGLLIGALGLALLAFILSDLFSSSNAWIGKFKDKVFSVDGDIVSTKEFFDRVSEYEVFEKAMRNGNNLDENMSTQIREYVYQQMVNEKVLNKEAEKLGLAVTEDEIYQMTYGDMISPVLLQSPFFMNPQTRQFDKEALSGFLSMLSNEPNVQEMQAQQVEMWTMQKTVWKVLRNMMIYNALNEKYSALVASAVSVNNTEAKAAHDDSKNISNLAYVVERYATIPDSTIKVEDKELKALYDLRKNNYKLDHSLMKVSYFYTDIVPSEEDYAAVEKEIQGVHETLKTSANPVQEAKYVSPDWNIDAFISMSEVSQAGLPADGKAFLETASVGDIYGPKREGEAYVMFKLVEKAVASDSVKLQMIPVQALGAVGDAAKVKADSLLAVIKGGKAFATVADEVMPGSNGGDMGWATEMRLSGAGIAKECFAAAKGDVLKLDINGQPQLVYIADKTNPVQKVKLAIVHMPVAISDKTQNGVENELNDFIAHSGNLENFDKAAVEKGYNIVTDQNITSADIALGQLQNSRSVINWAFNEKPGAVKKFDISNRRIVAIAKDKYEGEYKPLADVATELKAEIIRDKKAEKIIADLKAKNLTSLDAYAQAISSRVDTVTNVDFQTSSIAGIGYEPILNVYAKLGKVNQLSQPSKGRAGVYVVDVTNRTENTKEFDAESSKQALRRNTYSQIRYQSVFDLRSKMDVVDNRIAFY